MKKCKCKKNICSKEKYCLIESKLVKNELDVTIYVDSINGNDKNTGLNKKCPKKTLDSALNVSSLNNSAHIILEEGKYTINKDIVKNNTEILGATHTSENINILSSEPVPGKIIANKYFVKTTKLKSNNIQFISVAVGGGVFFPINNIEFNSNNEIVSFVSPVSSDIIDIASNKVKFIENLNHSIA